MIRLRIADGDDRRDVELEGGRLRIGRAPESEVRIASAEASREHAELVRERRGWVVRDLGSRNGTFVNGEPIQESDVGPGDVIGIGENVRLELLPEGAPGRRGRREHTEPEDATPAREEAAAQERPAGRGAPWRAVHWTLVPLSDRLEPVPLRGPVLTVGRDEGVGLHLDDPSISRMHARIDVDGPRLKVTDLKSSNGTWVNDTQVTAATLSPGDRLKFGDVEFEIARREGLAWGALARAAALPVLLLALGYVAVAVISNVMEGERARRAAGRFRDEAVETLRAGVEAARRGESGVARGFFAHAVQEYLLSGAAPADADATHPEPLLRELARELPSELRAFDFAAALDSSTVRRDEADLDAMELRPYVEHKLRAYCADLGQDPELPPEFVDQVWRFVQDYQRYPGSMRTMLRRARTLQPRINAVLARERLSPSVGYVAWVESELDPTRESPARALGLWQLMAPTARQYGLRVDEARHERDERTDVEKSTRAAARYIAEMLRDQGPEYYMLVLASYNRGHTALRAAKQQVDDPNLRSTQKYWYLVKKGILARETREYVPKILAVRLIAESPARFGF